MVDVDNKLIAEFMEIKQHPEFGFEGESLPTHKSYVHDYSLEYHSSWNWLMPVVQKAYGIIRDNKIPPTESEEVKLLLNTSIHASIQYTYMIVVNFIEWHNSQEKQATAQ